MKATSHTETRAPLISITYLPAASCSILQGSVLALPADKGALHHLGILEKALAPVCRYTRMDTRQMWHLIQMYLSSISQAIRHQEPQHTTG